MAEPEELEEDLFADLYVPLSQPPIHLNSINLTLFSSYDADESTNRTTSAVEASRPEEPAPSAVPAQPAGESYAPSYEPSAPDAYSSQPPPQMDFGMGYQNGSDAVSGPPVAAAPAEHEPQGTGIKEDG